MALRLGGTMIALVLAIVVLSLWIAQQPPPVLHTIVPPIPAHSGGGCYPSVCHDIPEPTPRQLTPFPRSSGLRNDATTTWNPSGDPVTASRKAT